MDLNEFKQTYPDIANALIREGYSKGYSAARDFNRKEKEKKEGDSFEFQVNEYIALHKCSKTVAMQAVIKKDPAAHRAYIEKYNSGDHSVKKDIRLDQGQQIKSGDGSGKDFLTQVEEYTALNKCSKTVAMQAVIKKDSAAHQTYIDQAQR